MISGRRAAREAALLILFGVDASHIVLADEALSLFRAHFRDDPDVLEAMYSPELRIDDPKQVGKAMKLLADDGTRWAFVDLASGRAIDVPQIVADAYEVVAADDPRLDTLGPARRLLQRYD